MTKKLLLGIILPCVLAVTALAVGLGVYFGAFYHKDDKRQDLATPNLPDPGTGPDVSVEYPEYGATKFHYIPETIDGAMYLLVDRIEGDPTEEIVFPEKAMYEGNECTVIGAMDACKYWGSLKKATTPMSFVRLVGTFYNSGIFEFDDRWATNVKTLDAVEMSGNILGVFGGCFNLVSAPNFPQLTTIGKYAFSNCGVLTSITLPSTVNEIGDYAFVNCLRLFEIVNHSPFILTAGSDYCGQIAKYALDVYNQGEEKLPGYGLYNQDGYELYKKQDNSIILLRYLGNETEPTIPNGVTEIYEQAFSGNGTITSIDMSDMQIVSIGDYAFRGCYALSSITLPNSLKSLGYQALGDCYSLTSLDLSNTKVEIIKSFYGCERLISIILPKTLTSIKDWAFENCGALTDVTIKSIDKDLVDSWLSGGAIAFEDSTYPSRSNITIHLSVDLADSGISSGPSNTYGYKDIKFDA